MTLWQRFIYSIVWDIRDPWKLGALTKPRPWALRFASWLEDKYLPKRCECEVENSPQILGRTVVDIYYCPKHGANR